MSNRFDLYQTGAEPEFCVRRVMKSDMIAPGVPRIYFVSERDGHPRLEFTMISSAACLRMIGLELLRIADDPSTAAPQDIPLGMN